MEFQSQPAGPSAKQAPAFVEECVTCQKTQGKGIGLALSARAKRGQTLSGHTISKSNQLPSKGSAPFWYGLIESNTPEKENHTVFRMNC